MQPPETPECDKMKACRPEIDAIEAFLNYLYENGYAVSEIGGDYYVDMNSMKTVVYKSLGIDAAKVSAEQIALLEYQRHLNKQAGF